MSELGTQLVRAREARGLTLEDAERDTRISRRYLQALESEQFEAIPAPVYARGFLRSYSQYLGLDPQKMLDLFPRDEDDPPSYQRDVSQRASPENPISATSASRPSWRRPQTSRPAQPPPQRTVGSQRAQRPGPAARRAYEEDAPDERGRYDDERNRYDERGRYDDERNRYDERGRYEDERDTYREEFEPPRRTAQRTRPREQSREPMIGVDIGVPAPARRIKTDPAAQTRTLAVVAVAVGAIIAVIIVALLLSRAGGSAAGIDVSPTADGADTTSQASTLGTNVETTTATATVAPGSPVKVPDVLNLQQSQAESAITGARLVASVIEQSATQPKGTVIDQAPAPGTDAVAGNTVSLVVSSGQ